MQSFDLRLWPDFNAAGGDIAEEAIIDQVVIDSRRITSNKALFVALPGRFQDGHHYLDHAAALGARFAVVSRDYTGVVPHNLNILRVTDSLITLQSIATYYRQQFKSLVVIAITGSMGKTMVKDLLFEMLAEQYSVFASPESFNSQIGVAMSLLQIEAHHQYALIEAGISQPGDMARLIKMINPQHAVLTCIAETHLHTMPDKTTLIQEKLQLLKAVPENNWTLLPDEFSKLMTVNKKTYAWDKKTGDLPHAVITGPTSIAQDITYQMALHGDEHFTGKIPGGQAYLLEHINIASKAAALLNINSKVLQQVLNCYSFRPVRVERWKANCGCTVINERYCSDLGSLLTALRKLARETKYVRKIFLWNGIRSKQAFTAQDMQQLNKAIKDAGVMCVVLGDPNVAHLVTETKECALKVYPSYQAALNFVASCVGEGDLLLVMGAIKTPLVELEQALDGAICDNKLIINFSAIEDNIQAIRHALPKKTRLMAMVKALGYGTDSTSLGQFLEACQIDIVGVAHVDEAIALRQAGITQAIFAIHMTEDEAQQVLDWDIEVAVSDEAQVASLSRAALSTKKMAKLHLHIDTGMARLGCRPEQALSLARTIQNTTGIALEGIMTHLACADMPEQDAFTLQQLQRFDQSVASLHEHGIKAPWIHAANSSGAMRFKSETCNMVRIGLGMFGLAPGLNLRPAISLWSRLVGINALQQSEGVGYGQTYLATRDNERIGILPLGYFDGIHTQYSGKGSVLVRGLPAPFVGRICMDFMMVDITAIEDAVIGDPVLVFGKDESHHSVDPIAFAKRGDTHVYQLITCLGPRIRRLFIYDEGL